MISVITVNSAFHESSHGKYQNIMSWLCPNKTLLECEFHIIVTHNDISNFDFFLVIMKF